MRDHESYCLDLYASGHLKWLQKSPRFPLVFIKGGTEPEFDLIGSGVTLSATLDTSVADQSASLLVSYVTKGNRVHASLVVGNMPDALSVAACSGMKVLTSQSPQQHLGLPDNRADLLFKEVRCRASFFEKCTGARLPTIVPLVCKRCGHLNTDCIKF